MEAVATVLDPILENMRQQPTMDVRTVSCNMMQILTLIRDTTVPNIEMMAKLIYTKSNSAEMKDRFSDYTISNENAVVGTAASNIFSEDGTSTCLLAPNNTTIRDRFFDLLDFLFDPCIEIGPIAHVVSIILLLIAFPISILVSLVSTIVLILYILTGVLRSILGLPDNTNDGYEGIIMDYIFTVTILAPILVAVSILRNIRGFFKI
jgi:hypothetical protein